MGERCCLSAFSLQQGNERNLHASSSSLAAMARSWVQQSLSKNYFALWYLGFCVSLRSSIFIARGAKGEPPHRKAKDGRHLHTCHSALPFSTPFAVAHQHSALCSLFILSLVGKFE